MKFSLSILSFMVCTFSVVSKKSLPKPSSSSSRLSPMISSRSFIVLHFTFRSMIHFEIIFVNGVWCVSRFFLVFVLLVDVQLFHHHLWKRLLLLHCIAFAPLSKIIWLYLMWIHIWALFPVLLICLSILFANTTLSWLS